MNIKKFTSLLTAFCFLVSFAGQNQAWAAAGTSSGIIGSAEFKKIFENIPNIPTRYGKVTAVSNKGSKNIVVNIQDLHCHPEAQKNIGKIIEILDKNYQVRNLYVEGGYDEIDISWLSSVEDKSLRDDLMLQMIEDGRLNASEYYAAKNDKKDFLFGLEDKAKHEENIKRLGYILEQQEKYDEVLASVRDNMDYWNAKYTNIRNKRFDRTIEKYRNNEIGAEKFYTILFKYVKKVNASPQNYNNVLPIKMSDYPNIRNFMFATKANAELDMKNVQTQMHSLLAFLKAKLPPQAFQMFLDETGNLSDIDRLAAALSNFSTMFGIDLDVNYKVLNTFFKLQELSKTINPIELLDEERHLIERLRISFSYDRTEIEIAFLNDFYGYFRDYLQNKLMANDFAFFDARFENFRELYEKYAAVNDLKAIEDDFETLNAYYRLNDKRNDIFTDNIFKYCGRFGEKMAEAVSDNPDDLFKNAGEIVIVVTGGYHSHGLKELLAKKDITSIIITPTVTTEIATAENIYEELIRQQSEFLREALAFTIASQSEQSQFEACVRAGISLMRNNRYTRDNIQALEAAIRQYIPKKDFKVSFGQDETVITFHNGKSVTIKKNGAGRMAFESLSENADLKSKKKKEVRIRTDVMPNLMSRIMYLAPSLIDTSILNPDVDTLLVSIIEFTEKHKSLPSFMNLFKELANGHSIKLKQYLKDNNNISDLYGIKLTTLARLPEALQNALVDKHMADTKKGAAVKLALVPQSGDTIRTQEKRADKEESNVTEISKKPLSGFKKIAAAVLLAVALSAAPSFSDSHRQELDALTPPAAHQIQIEEGTSSSAGTELQTGTDVQAAEDQQTSGKIGLSADYILNQTDALNYFIDGQSRGPKINEAGRVNTVENLENSLRESEKRESIDLVNKAYDLLESDKMGKMKLVFSKRPPVLFLQNVSPSQRNAAVANVKNGFIIVPADFLQGSIDTQIAELAAKIAHEATHIEDERNPQNIKKILGDFIPANLKITNENFAMYDEAAAWKAGTDAAHRLLGESEGFLKENYDLTRGFITIAENNGFLASSLAKHTNNGGLHYTGVDIPFQNKNLASGHVLIIMQDNNNTGNTYTLEINASKKEIVKITVADKNGRTIDNIVPKPGSGGDKLELPETAAEADAKGIKGRVERAFFVARKEFIPSLQRGFAERHISFTKEAAAARKAGTTAIRAATVSGAVIGAGVAVALTVSLFSVVSLPVLIIGGSIAVGALSGTLGYSFNVISHMIYNLTRRGNINTAEAGKALYDGQSIEQLLDRKTELLNNIPHIDNAASYQAELYNIDNAIADRLKTIPENERQNLQGKILAAFPKDTKEYLDILVNRKDDRFLLNVFNTSKSLNLKLYALMYLRINGKTKADVSEITKQVKETGAGFAVNNYFDLRASLMGTHLLLSSSLTDAQNKTIDSYVQKDGHTVYTKISRAALADQDAEIDYGTEAYSGFLFSRKASADLMIKAHELGHNYLYALAPNLNADESDVKGMIHELFAYAVQAATHETVRKTSFFDAEKMEFSIFETMAQPEQKMHDAAKGFIKNIKTVLSSMGIEFAWQDIVFAIEAFAKAAKEGDYSSQSAALRKFLDVYAERMSEKYGVDRNEFINNFRLAESEDGRIILRRMEVVNNVPTMDNAEDYALELGRADEDVIKRFAELKRNGMLTAAYTPSETAYLENVLTRPADELKALADNPAAEIKHRLYAMLMLKGQGVLHNFDGLIGAFEKQAANGEINIENYFDLRAMLTGMHALTMSKNKNFEALLRKPEAVYWGISRAAIVERGQHYGADFHTAMYLENSSIDGMRDALAHRYSQYTEEESSLNALKNALQSATKDVKASDKKLTLPETAAEADRRGLTGLKRIFFTAHREVIPSLQRGFAERHISLTKEAAAARKAGTTAIRAATVTGAVIGAAVTAALAISLFSVISLPALIAGGSIAAGLLSVTLGYSFNVVTHVIYNLFASKGSELTLREKIKTKKYYHGGITEDFSFANLDVFRLARKQQKRGRAYSGFYLFDEDSKSSADRYARNTGAETGVGVFEIDADANILELPNNGGIERITQERLQELRGQGYDMISGPNILGKTEYILLNKGIVQSYSFELFASEDSGFEAISKSADAVYLTKIIKSKNVPAILKFHAFNRLGELDYDLSEVGETLAKEAEQLLRDYIKDDLGVLAESPHRDAKLGAIGAAAIIFLKSKHPKIIKFDYNRIAKETAEFRWGNKTFSTKDKYGIEFGQDYIRGQRAFLVFLPLAAHEFAHKIHFEFAQNFVAGDKPNHTIAELFADSLSLLLAAELGFDTTPFKENLYYKDEYKTLTDPAKDNTPFERVFTDPYTGARAFLQSLAVNNGGRDLSVSQAAKLSEAVFNVITESSNRYVRLTQEERNKFYKEKQNYFGGASEYFKKILSAWSGEQVELSGPNSTLTGEFPPKTVFAKAVADNIKKQRIEDEQKARQEKRERRVAVAELIFTMPMAFSSILSGIFIWFHGPMQSKETFKKRQEGMLSIRVAMTDAWEAAADKATNRFVLIRLIQRAAFGMAGTVNANIYAHVKYNLANPDARLSLFEKYKNKKYYYAASKEKALQMLQNPVSANAVEGIFIAENSKAGAHAAQEKPVSPETYFYTVKPSIDEERNMGWVNKELLEKAKKATFPLYLSNDNSHPLSTLSLVEFEINGKPHRYLMSSSHALKNADFNDVQFSIDPQGRQRVSTKVAFDSPALDIAFLEVPQKLDGIEPLKVSSKPAAKGDRVFFFGYSIMDEEMSAGSVQYEDGYKGILTTLIPIEGTCGSAILNENGEVIGIRRARGKNEALAEKMNAEKEYLKVFPSEAPIQMLGEFVDFSLNGKDYARSVYLEGTKVFDISFAESITGTKYYYTDENGILKEQPVERDSEGNTTLSVYNNMGTISRFFRDPLYKEGRMELTVANSITGLTKRIIILTEGKKVISVQERMRPLPESGSDRTENIFEVSFPSEAEMFAFAQQLLAEDSMPSKEVVFSIREGKAGKILHFKNKEELDSFLKKRQLADEKAAKEKGNNLTGDLSQKFDPRNVLEVDFSREFKPNMFLEDIETAVRKAFFGTINEKGLGETLISLHFTDMPVPANDADLEQYMQTAKNFIQKLSAFIAYGLAETDPSVKEFPNSYENIIKRDSFETTIFELLKNAFSHGNHFDLSKNIYLYIGKDAGEIYIINAATPGEASQKLMAEAAKKGLFGGGIGTDVSADYKFLRTSAGTTVIFIANSFFDYPENGKSAAISEAFAGQWETRENLGRNLPAFEIPAVRSGEIIFVTAEDNDRGLKRSFKIANFDGNIVFINPESANGFTISQKDGKYYLRSPYFKTTLHNPVTTELKEKLSSVNEVIVDFGSLFEEDLFQNRTGEQVKELIEKKAEELLRTRMQYSDLRNYLFSFTLNGRGQTPLNAENSLRAAEIIAGTIARLTANGLGYGRVKIDPYDISEILLNAIVHGNNLDLSKEIVMYISETGNEIFIMNAESGENISLEKLAEATKIEIFGEGMGAGSVNNYKFANASVAGRNFFIGSFLADPSSDRRKEILKKISPKAKLKNVKNLKRKNFPTFHVDLGQGEQRTVRAYSDKKLRTFTITNRGGIIDITDSEKFITNERGSIIRPSNKKDFLEIRNENGENYIVSEYTSISFGEAVEVVPSDTDRGEKTANVPEAKNIKTAQAGITSVISEKLQIADGNTVNINFDEFFDGANASDLKKHIERIFSGIDFQKPVLLSVVFNGKSSRHDLKSPSKEILEALVTNISGKTKMPGYPLFETLKNALTHGNRMDPSKPVLIYFNGKNDLLIINEDSEAPSSLAFQSAMYESGIYGQGLGTKASEDLTDYMFSRTVSAYGGRTANLFIAGLAVNKRNSSERDSLLKAFNPQAQWQKRTDIAVSDKVIAITEELKEGEKLYLYQDLGGRETTPLIYIIKENGVYKAVNVSKGRINFESSKFDIVTENGTDYIVTDRTLVKNPAVNPDGFSPEISGEKLLGGISGRGETPKEDTSVKPAADAETPSVKNIPKKAGGFFSLLFSQGKARQILVNYHFIKQSGITNAVKEFGNAATLTEEGYINLPVYVVNERPENFRDMDFKNTGVSINGNPLWVSRSKDTVIIYGEGASREDISRELMSNRKINELIKQSAKNGTKTNVKNVSVEWIEVDHANIGKAITYSENGNVQVGYNLFRQMLARGEMLDFSASLRKVKNIDGFTLAQGVLHNLDDVGTAQDFIDYLKQHQKIGNGQIVINTELAQKISDEIGIMKFAEFLNAARKDGVQVFLLLSPDASMMPSKFENTGFAGYIYANAKTGKTEMYNYALGTASGVKTIEFNSRETLEAEIKKAGENVILNNSELKNIINGEKSIVALSQIVDILSSFKILKLFTTEKMTPDFALRAARNFDITDMPETDPEKIAAITELYAANDFKGIVRALNLQESHVISVYLMKITNQTDEDEVYNSFVTGITEKLLTAASLRKAHKPQGLQNNAYETILGRSLLLQAVEKTEGKGVSVSHNSLGRTMKEAEEKLYETLQSLTSKAFENKDPQAINAIAELIPAIAEERRKRLTKDEIKPDINIKDYESIMTAA